VRALLAEDVRLDLIERSRRTGKVDVGGYVERYAAAPGWRLAAAWLEGREVVAVFRSERDAHPGYFIDLTIEHGRVTAIRDFRYVPYIAREAPLEIAAPARHEQERRRAENGGG
jgi:RNA polymerase sigma-70 factor (ECF subfamily)